MSRSRLGVGAGVALGLFLIGALFLTGGLVFLCAAVEMPARLPVALALLIIGGVLSVFAGIHWRRLRRQSPGLLAERITKLAAAHNGEVTTSLIVSQLDVPDEAARAALDRLESRGLCYPERRDGKALYVFPGLTESKVVRRCAYCGNEYSVREPLHKCPNCGGELEIAKSQ